MTREQRIKVRTYIERFPEAFFLAILTAIVTMVLAIILSVFVGQDARNERAATRCYAAAAVNMLHAAFEANPEYAQLRDEFPEINTEGLDCRSYLTSTPEALRQQP